MVKIYHRPDPPPPDVDSNRAIRKTETYLNREANAGLFQRALVKAQGQEQAVERSMVADSSQQEQIESDADAVLGSKPTTAQSEAATQSETAAKTVQNTAHDVAQTPDMAELTQAEELPEDSAEVDTVDQDEQAPDGDVAPSVPDSTAAYQLFENIRDLGNQAEPAPQADTNTDNASEGVSTQRGERDERVTAQSAVAHSAAATAASMESRIDSMSSMSDLIDMLESASQLPMGNEWTLILEDDGPVSELTLSSDPDGRWNIDLLTSFDNDAIDDELIGSLRNQLDTAGIAVANISLLDAATTDAVSGKPSTTVGSDSSNLL